MPWPERLASNREMRAPRRRDTPCGRRRAGGHDARPAWTRRYLGLRDAHPSGAHLQQGRPSRPYPNASKPVGSGPFKFTEWKKGQYWSADYNPDWWGLTADDAYGTSKPAFEALKFVFRPEDAARMAMVQSGEAQIAMFPSADECERAKDNEAYDCVTGPSTTYLYGRLDHSLYADERLLTF